MRLGGPVSAEKDDPIGWAKAVRKLGYTAAYCPLEADVDDATCRAYEAAARDADVVIAEVGVWNNPLSRDARERKKNIAACQKAIDLADRVGARCCVNIAGTFGKKWDGPFAGDLTPDGFEAIVGSVREIVDGAKPKRAFYTLETMPWMYPDSPESYLKLMKAIDRKQVAVHLDPVNIINSPQRYFENAAFIRHCFKLLGSRIKSCHAKDVILGQNLTVHLDECRPGTGGLDYGVYLEEAAKLHPDTPIMLEHLPNAEEYKLAAKHVRAVAKKKGLSL